MPEIVPEENKRIVREFYETCINAGNLERLEEIVSPDFVGASGEKGVSAFRSTVESLKTGYPDIRFTIEDLIAEGDRVAVRWRWEATHTGSFRGIPATGKTVTDTGIAIYQVQGQQLVRAWLETDRLGVLQQLGLIAPTPTLIAEAQARAQAR